MFHDDSEMQKRLGVVGKKWSIPVIMAIGMNNDKKARYIDIKRQLKDATPRAMIRTLRELEMQGTIKRISLDGTPNVEYCLTENGLELYVALTPLVKWASIVPGRAEPRGQILGDGLG